MNPTRTGKIARLPLDVRTELNDRLQEGEPGKEIVAWLNTLPEVETMVEKFFFGRPIREQNLSEWKQGGYREWLVNQEARETLDGLEEETEEWFLKHRPPVSDTLARWLAVRYASEARQLDTLEGPERWRRLRDLCADVAELRRGDHRARRLDIEDSRDMVDIKRLGLEMERVALAERDSLERSKRTLTHSFEVLFSAVKGNPEAAATLGKLIRLLRHAYDTAAREQCAHMTGEPIPTDSPS